jgi:hypothetical protein
MADQRITKAIHDLRDHICEAAGQNLAKINGSGTDLVYQSRQLILESRRIMEEADKILAGKVGDVR